MASDELSLTRRKFLGLAGGAVAGVAVAGSRKDWAFIKSASEAPAVLGKPPTLRLLNVGSDSDAAGITLVRPMLKDALGVTLVQENLPYNSVEAKALAELASGSPGYDLFIMDTPWTPTVTHVLEPLSSYMTSTTLNKGINLDPTDFIPKVFYDTSVYKINSPSVHYPSPTSPVDPQAIVRNGFEIMGLPIQSNALVMGYRKDLLDSPAERARYQKMFGKPLAVPVSWDEFLQVATFFNNPRKGFYGTTVLGGPQEGWDFCDFKTISGSWGADPHVISDSYVVDGSATAVEAWQFYCNLVNKYKVAPLGASAAGWDSVIALFAAGQTAFTWNYNSYRMNPGIKGTIGYALMPKKVRHAPHFGTWQLSIPKALPSARKAWAYRTAAWLTSAQAQIAMLPTELHPSRVSVFAHARKDPKVTALYGNFYTALEESLAVGYGRPRVRNYDAIVQPYVTDLNAAETGQGTVKAEVEKAANATVALLKANGYTSARAALA